jgi:DNA-binding transcriptional MerR regulator
MYTIKGASEQTGVPVATLRAWDRRYGISAPMRSEAGYRLYDENTIVAISSMARLIAAGWAPKQASADILRRLAKGTLSSGALGEELEESVDDELTEAFIETAKNFDGTRLAQVLDLAFALGSFEFVIDHWLMPTLRRLGEEWVAGRVDVANEHYASNAVVRRLNAAFESAAQVKTGRPVIVGLPSGSYHEMGVLAFATVARRRGMEVMYLGADVPPAAWTSAIGNQESAAVFIGVMTSWDIASTRYTLESLLITNPDIFFAIGGPQAHMVRTDAHVFRQSISDTVNSLAALLEK